MTKPLDGLRKQIDEIDQKLVELISQRGAAALLIGQEKSALNRLVQDPLREDEVFKHVTQLNPGPLPDEELRQIFESLVAACSRLQKEQSSGCADA